MFESEEPAARVRRYSTGPMARFAKARLLEGFPVLFAQSVVLRADDTEFTPRVGRVTCLLIREGEVKTGRSIVTLEAQGLSIRLDGASGLAGVGIGRSEIVQEDGSPLAKIQGAMERLQSFLVVPHLDQHDPQLLL